MKKENRVTAILFLIAAICSFTSAIISVVEGNNVEITDLGLGICSLALFSAYYKKDDKDKK